MGLVILMNVYLKNIPVKYKRLCIVLKYFCKRTDT